jgi:putative CocE/NonD family hydrolase
MRRAEWTALLALALVTLNSSFASAQNASQVDVHWNVEIPLRDGRFLHATLYTPRDRSASLACVFALTPYTADAYHDRGMYFAAHGYSFASIDVRGRGGSPGVFEPFTPDAHDGYDVVEWLAPQPHCKGKVAMWGGSSIPCTASEISTAAV